MIKNRTDYWAIMISYKLRYFIFLGNPFYLKGKTYEVDITSKYWKLKWHIVCKKKTRKFGSLQFVLLNNFSRKYFTKFRSNFATSLLPWDVSTVCVFEQFFAKYFKEFRSTFALSRPGDVVIVCVIEQFFGNTFNKISFDFRTIDTAIKML